MKTIKIFLCMLGLVVFACSFIGLLLYLVAVHQLYGAIAAIVLMAGFFTAFVTNIEKLIEFVDKY